MSRRAILLGSALLLSAPDAAASEITAFLSIAKPDEVWAGGLGGAFSLSFFSILHFEAELARQPAEDPDASMYTFTGSVLVAPPLGRLVPYAGLGIGGFRQELGALSDTGTLHALVAGLKFKLAPVFLVKGEYRRIDLSGDPLLPLDHRLEIQARQHVDHRVAGNLDAEHALDARERQRDRARRDRVGVGVVVLDHLRARAEIEYEPDGAPGGGHREIGVDAALEPHRGVGAKLELPRGVADVDHVE